MQGKKLGLTKDDLLVMREQGMSNKDIAASLDIAPYSVYRLIGKRGGRMDSFAAFDTIPKKPKIGAKTVEKKTPPRVKYAPEVVSESYRLHNDLSVAVSFDSEAVSVLNNDGFIDIPFADLPEVVQALAFVLREKVEPKLQKKREEAEVESYDE